MAFNRLTTAQKNEILARLDEGKTQAAIAEEFGVTEGTIVYYRKKQREGITRIDDPPPPGDPRRKIGPQRRFRIDEQNDILKRLAAGEPRYKVAAAYGVRPTSLARYVDLVRAGTTHLGPRPRKGGKGGWPKGKPRKPREPDAPDAPKPKAKPGPKPKPAPPIAAPVVAEVRPPVRREAHGLSVYERGQIVLACTRGKRPIAEVADEYGVPHDYVHKMVKTALGVAVAGVSVWV